MRGMMVHFWRTSVAGAAAMAVLVLLAVPAKADTVVLTNGNRFEGRIVSENDRQVILQTDAGELVLKRSDIKEIISGPWTPKPKDAKPAPGSKTGSAKTTTPPKKPAPGKAAKPPPEKKPATPKPPPKPPAKPPTKPKPPSQSGQGSESERGGNV